MNDTLTLVQSYLQWWEMAGFDHAMDSKTINWLETKEKKQALIDQKNESFSERLTVTNPHPEIPAQSKLNEAHTNSKIIPKIYIDEKDWPQTIEDLHTAFKNGDALPGNLYSDERILPRRIEFWANDIDTQSNGEQQNSRTLMLIGDIPNEQDIREKMIFSGKQNNLIVNMMTAGNFNNFDIYCTNIATTRPQFDELPQQDLTSLYALLRHHIALLKPNAIISFGSACCNALLNAELMNSRKNLHYFNHNNINKPLIATFHPRSLIAQPQLKRQAWRDLQVLMKKDIL